ncbi:MAG TPA: ATP-binding cassette domain-containing protein [Candidatus Deferrimicrobiaceae bacterium]
MALLNMRGISVAFGGPPLLEQVDFRIEPGERVCLIGRNGTGKSTLLKLVNGDLPPDGGEVVRQQGLKVALVPQEAPPGLSGTVYDIVCGGNGELSRLLAEHHRIATLPPGRHDDRWMRELSRVQDALGACGGWSIQQEADKAISRLDLDPDADFDVLSGGVRRRVLIARALCHGSDLLVLDEPTNHLDIEAIARLEEFLLRGGPTLLFVTHDRTFLRRVATRIVELDRGRLFDWGCGYDTFLERRAAALEAESVQWSKFDKRLSEEEAWIRKGIKARGTRNEGRVRALKSMREERRARRELTGTVRMQATDATVSGRIVVEAAGVCAGYDPGKPVVRDCSITIMRGDRVGIIGPNGSGKTTLIRTLIGDLAPLSGHVRLGTKLEIAWSDQLREQLDEDKSVADNLGDGNDTVTVGGRTRHIIGYLGDFLFPPDRARSPVRMLSGGERNRLQLAKLFTKPFNLLVLDEPTNDLDIETLDLLEELLLDYSGTLLLVSHDRAFLDNVVTSTLVIAADGTVSEFIGGYEDWVAQRPKPTAAPGEAAAPLSDRERPRRDATRKLNYREQRELKGLPGQIVEAEVKIAALEAERDALHAEMADPDFYRDDASLVVGARSRLETLEGKIAEAYAMWEALEEKRSALSAIDARMP